MALFKHNNYLSSQLTNNNKAILFVFLVIVIIIIHCSQSTLIKAPTDEDIKEIEELLKNYLLPNWSISYSESDSARARLIQIGYPTIYYFEKNYYNIQCTKTYLWVDDKNKLKILNIISSIGSRSGIEFLYKIALDEKSPVIIRLHATKNLLKHNEAEKTIPIIMNIINTQYLSWNDIVNCIDQLKNNIDLEVFEPFKIPLLLINGKVDELIKIGDPAISFLKKALSSLESVNSEILRNAAKALMVLDYENSKDFFMAVLVSPFYEYTGGQRGKNNPVVIAISKAFAQKDSIIIPFLLEELNRTPKGTGIRANQITRYSDGTTSVSEVNVGGNQYPYTRVMAAKALGYIKNKIAVPHLKKIIEDFKNDNLIYACIDAIYEIDPASTPLFLNSIFKKNNCSDEIRNYIIKFLASTNNQNVDKLLNHELINLLKFLGFTLDTDNEELKKYVKRNSDHLSVRLLGCLNEGSKASNNSDNSFCNIIICSGFLGDSRAIVPISKLLSKGYWLSSCVFALGEIGGQESAKTLGQNAVRYYHDSNAYEFNVAFLKIGASSLEYIEPLFNKNFLSNRTKENLKYTIEKIKKGEKSFF